MLLSLPPKIATRARGGGFSFFGIRTVLVAGAALLACPLIACAWWFVETSRSNQLSDGQRELTSLSRALSEETDRVLQGAEVVQTSVLENLGAMGVASEADLARLSDSIDTHEMLKRIVSNVLFVNSLAIVDASGRIVSASDFWPAPQVNLANREYFKALARDPTLREAVDDLGVGKVTGTATIRLGKRLSGPSGEFLGVVLATVKAAFLESAYSSFVMPGGRVSLFRDDGVLLARAPHFEAEFRKRYGADPMFNGQAPGNEGVVTLQHADDDRPPHVVAFSRLSHFPLVITVSKGLAAMLAKGDALARAFYLATAAILALIATTVIVLIRSFDQQRRTAEADKARIAAEVQVSAQQQILTQAGRFEVALNNMLQGLCMFDTRDRLIVCNARYAEMYELPEHLTRPGAHWRDIVAHRLDRFGYRDLDLDAVVAQHEGLDLTRNENARTRELNDGRVILVRHQPIPEGGWVATHEDITERRKAEERLSEMARHDALTGLPNRLLLQERLKRAVAGLADDERFAVLCLDLDHFKEINDTLGHAVGDALLRDFAARLRASVRKGDTVARLGGDEFAILQTGISGQDDVADFAKRLVAVLNEPYEIAGQQINTGASFGIACAPRDGDEGAMLLRLADIALYRAKAENRRGYRFFEAGMDIELQSRRNLEVEFRKALQDGAFEVFYQPLLDARTRTIRSFEALVRWRHPDRGLIAPIEFIPLAEETGLIVPLGEWVLRTACREASRWPADVCVSVNLSAHQFKALDLVEKVRGALTDAKLAGSRLELEITESTLLQESHRTLEILHEFRDMGVKIAMDDFGTGYSSLSYLRSFPFDKIKIDKSFVQNLDQLDARAIVRSIASLGKTLAMTTTAEGVETETQLAAVIDKGCVEVQGYLFSKPVPASQVDALLDKYHRTEIAA